MMTEKTENRELWKKETDRAHGTQIFGMPHELAEKKEESGEETEKVVLSKWQATKWMKPYWQTGRSGWLSSSSTSTSTNSRPMEIGNISELKEKCESSVPFWVEKSASEKETGMEWQAHTVVESGAGLGREQETGIFGEEREKGMKDENKGCECSAQMVLEDMRVKRTDERCKEMEKEEGEEWAREEVKKEMGKEMEGIGREKGWKLEERKRGEMVKRWRWEDWEAAGGAEARCRQEKRKERVLRWRRQVEDAMKHWKVFGVWVRKEWEGMGGVAEWRGEEAEEETRMWDEAERHVLEKETEREESGGKGENEGMGREEQQVERYERAKRKGAKAEDLDANTEHPDLRYGGYGGVRRSKRSGKDRETRKKIEESPTGTFPSGLLSQMLLEEMGQRGEGDEGLLFQEDLKPTRKLLEFQRWLEAGEMGDGSEVENEGEMRKEEESGEREITSEGVSGMSGVGGKDEWGDWLMRGWEREDEMEEDENENADDDIEGFRNGRDGEGKKSEMAHMRCLRVIASGGGGEKGGEGEREWELGVRDPEEILRRFYDARSGMRQMRRERRRGKGGEEGMRKNGNGERKEMRKGAQEEVIVAASVLWMGNETSEGQRWKQRQMLWLKMETLRKSMSCAREKLFEHNPLFALRSERLNCR
ncbi:uncharacterized protein MONOS_1338 [Monocercomonoides exilis]|uniref:uncharacterized protein n=1 Tax=Monocercomonoides exilis TaxID=2049356 RepID=UPI00355A37CD|nr:hypothetical protein MONOS_1338 [Monocercomonoides exilis]|eukprot:MONOS_1338.1-p1 / transcript=MONOS_1338.1 / gene=MONOS_1338 / organism=Monocercomonoides_exilis_PA203 / gene_product=unspecified product / transcript_product=unspecified product / location=Mono_scaffold00023:56785-58734(-) / protein_length=650 / sequence_SO=supercontig / SO=protein_coding / is_pseudo=false